MGREIALLPAKSQGETGEKTRGHWGGCAVLSEILPLISQPGGTWVSYALTGRILPCVLVGPVVGLRTNAWGVTGTPSFHARNPPAAVRASKASACHGK